MKKEHESIAEKILYLLKNKGSFNWNEYIIPKTMGLENLEKSKYRLLIQEIQGDLIQLGYLRQAGDNPYGEWYRLTPEGEDFVSFESGRHEKLQDKMFKWYESENAKAQFEDYPITQKRAKWSIILAWIAVGLSALTLLQRLMCNTPHQP
jgi:hypothetical protein